MQFATNELSWTCITQTIKSPYPAHNIWRRNELVATDMIYAQTPAIDMGGQTMAQIYIGCLSLAIDIYVMSTEKEFGNTLMDNIKQQCAMDKLISDSTRVETSQWDKDIL